jgi:hypothetical protein
MTNPVRHSAQLSWHSWASASSLMPPASAFRHTTSQSGTGAYRTGSPYFGTGLVPASAFFFIPVPAIPTSSIYKNWTKAERRTPCTSIQLVVGRHRIGLDADAKTCNLYGVQCTLSTDLSLSAPTSGQIHAVTDPIFLKSQKSFSPSGNPLLLSPISLPFRKNSPFHFGVAHRVITLDNPCHLSGCTVAFCTRIQDVWPKNKKHVLNVVFDNHLPEDYQSQGLGRLWNSWWVRA